MVKLNVEKMSCKHCEEKIIKALISKGITSKISLTEKTVEVLEKNVAQAIDIINALGYKVVNNA